ncbi:phage tail tape measure protein [Oceanobacillus sp. E9]|uniref:phage tail tape measure protein n=1 Tax=Oceanobacillus sp. E9 TaxID=1742575 RepID=UPI00084E9C3B|nr:phage tail tape measure protein [Oceanobacillus sp. E9]OEH52992.1 phage tail tape measure protein [Oceanobacillus sp. E9]
MVNVGSLRTTISLDSAQFQQGMAGVNRQLKSLKQEQKAVTSSGTGFARGLTEMRDKSDVLTRTLDLQRGKVQELQRRYEESKRATGENSKETQKATEAYNKAVAEMNRTEEQLKNLNAEIERQENPWNRLSEQMDNTGQKMQDFGRGMSDFGKNWTMKVTAPIVGAGALMLKTGMDFEQSMSNVQAVSGATGDDLAKLEGAAREMGSQTSKSASEAADGLYYMALAGWETEEMLGGLEPILRLSEAGAMDLGRASDLVTDSMSAMQIEVKDLPAYLDNVAEASRRSNTNIDALMEAYVVAGGNLAAFNVPLEESTAILGLLANRGLKGSEAGRALNAVMVNLTSGAGQAGAAMEELGISAFDSDGNFIGLEDTLRLVKDRTKDMTEEQKAQYISMLAGKEHLKSFQGMLAGLDEEYGELKGSVSDADGALNDMATTMQDNAQGNVTRLKSAFEELSIQFAEHLLPMFTAGVEKAQDLVEWFSELEDDTKKNIVTMAGLAAAVGPAAIVLGNLTTAVGGLLRVGGSLSKMIGTAKGAGMAGRIGLLGLGGPTGLAIAGVAALGAVFLATRDSGQKLHDVNYDLIESVDAEIEALNDLESQFSGLHDKNKLTTDEMLRYMDIMDEIANAKSEEAIAKLKDEQAELLEKSGLTNKEMDTFLQLNDEVVEKSPSVTTAISDQGNAYVDNLEALKELNVEKRKELIMNANRELEKALENETALIIEQKDLQTEINEMEQDRNDAYQARFELSNQIAEEEIKQNEINQQIKDLKAEMEGLDGDALHNAESKLAILELEKIEQDTIVESLEHEKREQGKIYDKLTEKLSKKREDLAVTEEELKEIDKLQGDYEQLILAQADITAEKGKGLQKVYEEIEKIKDAKSELDRKHKSGEITTEEYEKQNRKLSDQKERLLDAKGQLEDINTLAGETIYDKEVNVNANPSLSAFNRDWSQPISKRINLNAQVATTGGLTGAALRGYATGTNNHPGGAFIAGEEGWELGRKGNQWEMLNFGLYDRPQGYQVFPHDESKKILNALNNTQIPGYATGARPPGEANRIIDEVNNPSSSQPVVIEVHVTSEMDSKAVGQGVARVVTDIQRRDTNRARRRPS